jgi:hypothetical protein
MSGHHRENQDEDRQFASSVAADRGTASQTQAALNRALRGHPGPLSGQVAIIQELESKRL